MGFPVYVNGKVRNTDTESRTLERLVGGLGLDLRKVALELNGEIVEQGEWENTLLQAGDRIEVVHFVGGG